MANPTKVLTYDGLLYYTQLLKTRLGRIIPSTITLTKSASNATVALTCTEGTGTATTIPAVDSTYAGLMTPTMLSKLNGIESGAEANVLANWTETNTSSDAYILNKPNLATVATSGSYDDLSNKPSIPDDSGLVHIAGAETITGNKAFTGSTSIDNGTVLGQLLIDNDNGLGEIILEDETEAGWIQIKRKTGNSTETLQSALNAKQNVIDSSHKLSADLISDGTTNKAYTATEKTKLEGIESGAQVNVLEAVKLEGASSDLTITSKKVTIPKASSSSDGIMTSSDYTKLSGIETGAEENVVIGALGGGGIDPVTGNPRLLVTFTVNSSKYIEIPYVDDTLNAETPGLMDPAQKTKLDGIAAGAQVNVIEKIKLGSQNSDLNIDSTNKRVTIPVDTTATNGSTNPITSDAVYDINTDLTNKLNNRIAFITYKSDTAPSSPTVDEYWYDTTNQVLKKYRGIVGGSPSWSTCTSSTNPFIVGIFEDARTGDDEVYIFTHTNGIFKVADDIKITSALALKAPLASPALTGTPTAPTAASGTNSTLIATTAFVQTAISAAVTGSFKFVNSLPSTGEEGYIYLVPHTHSGSSTNTNPDIKDEYIWNTSATPAQWELIGNTDLDLSNYWDKTDLVEMTTTDVTNVWNTGMEISNS